MYIETRMTPIAMLIYSISTVIAMSLVVELYIIFK